LETLWLATAPGFLVTGPLRISVCYITDRLIDTGGLRPDNPGRLPRCSRSLIGLKRWDAQRFAENRIDFSVLPELTDQDIEKIGVVLGDQRKIMRAIRELGPTAQPPVIGAIKPQDTAERRQVTVMFSDLVGSLAKAKSGEGQAGSHCIRATDPPRNSARPRHTDSALYPTICQIERAARFTRDEPRR
jgi:hypothetical protein